MKRSTFKAVVSVAVFVVHFTLVGLVLYRAFLVAAPNGLMLDEAQPLLLTLGPITGIFAWAALRYVQALRPDATKVPSLKLFFFLALLTMHSAYTFRLLQGYAMPGFPIQELVVAVQWLLLGETLFGAMLGYIFFSEFDPPPDQAGLKATNTVASVAPSVPPTLADDAS